MARLRVQTPGISPEEIRLSPGCNRVGREGDVEILLAHPSVSRNHCELWLTDDAVLVRDLGSRNGVLIDGQRVEEGQVTEGQTLRLGDIDLLLTEGPVKISVPDLPLPPPPKAQQYFEDGTPCCLRHENERALYQCTKCSHAFCGQCVRELRVAGGTPRRFCPDCGSQCERIVPAGQQEEKKSWLDKIVKVLMKPPPRR